MGCSSSALNKTGDSNRIGSRVPSNENSSTVEQSKFCVAQPKPCIPRREATPEKPKASVLPTANGVKSYHQPSLANDEAPGKDATDQSGPTKKTEPLVLGEECELSQPGGKDDSPGAEEMKEDVNARTEVQSLKGNAETESLGTEARSQPLGMSAERDSTRAGEDTETSQTGVMEPPETAENILPLETAKGPPPEEATGKDAQPPILEAIPEENNFPEILEGYQFVEKVEQKELRETLRKDKPFQLLETIPKDNTPAEIAGGRSTESSEQQQPWETLGKDEQPQVLEVVLKENETPQRPDRSQLAQTTVMNESPRETPDSIRNAHESQPEATGGSGEQAAGAAETAAKAETARGSHTDKEEHHNEGETGEKVEAEMKNEKESEEAKTKEKETGDTVDLEASGDGDGRASVHGVITEGGKI